MFSFIAVKDPTAIPSLFSDQEYSYKSPLNSRTFWTFSDSICAILFSGRAETSGRRHWVFRRYHYSCASNSSASPLPYANCLSAYILPTSLSSSLLIPATLLPDKQHFVFELHYWFVISDFNSPFVTLFASCLYHQKKWNLARVITQMTDWYVQGDRVI